MQILVQSNHFRWTLSQPVGRNAPNKPDDVELVRFGYAMARIDPLVTFRLKMADTLTRMAPKGGYGPDLQAVIDAHQRLRGGTQDGKVSPEKPTHGTGETYDGGHTWIMVTLDNSMRDMNKGVYPRIDKHDLCGPFASATSLALLTWTDV